MNKAQIFEKVKQVLKKHWWYFVLLIGSTVYVFIYKNDIYQLTELNTHNLVFLLWLVLLALPLFSEIEIGSVKLKKEVEKTRAEVKEAIGELKLQILDIKIANSNSNTFVVNNQPLPSKDELFHLQDSIESDTLSNHLENTKFKISEDNVYLFKVRLSLENQMSALCNMLQCSEHRSTYSMVLAHSAGMLTDSRSFTSFPRHEYYRRILCAKLGKLVDGGQYPADIAALGRIVENVCWKNAAALLRL